MKLAIVGSRDFDNYQLLIDTMNKWFYRSSVYEGPGSYGLTEVISGGAKGADYLGAKWCKECGEAGIKLTEYLPDWEKYGKKAGIIRNEDIVKNSDMILAFWDGKSKGTANSLTIAKKLKKPTIIVYF